MEYALDRYLPLHLRMQKIAELYPEAEPFLSELDRLAAQGVGSIIQGYMTKQTFRLDETPSWLR
jgi:hypothetical protein